MKGAISHSETSPLQTPDWNAIALRPAQEAATALRSILIDYERILEDAETKLSLIRGRIFNIRMCAFRIISGRELWKLDIDPDFGIPYTSMYRWMQVLYPNDSELRYAIEANTTQKALPAASLLDLGEMKRCNAVELASKFISDECRSDPSVIEATKTATRKKFLHILTVTHDQKLEYLETIGPFTYPAKDASQIREFLNWVIEKADLDADDHQGALLYLAIHENEEHRIGCTRAVEYERRKAMA